MILPYRGYLKTYYYLLLSMIIYQPSLGEQRVLVSISFDGIG